MVEQHQNYLLVAKTEIEHVAQQVLDLQTRLEQNHQTLAKLVEDYQKERYHRQEEIWQGLGLIRCTSCYEVPPDPVNETQGWGLMKPEGAHFVSYSYTTEHHYHEGDSSRSHLVFDRLCDPCYISILKSRAHGGGGLKELKPETVNEIDQILATSYEYRYKSGETLEKKFGFYDDIKVKWHKLPIPEGAYEIGQKVSLEDLANQLQIKPRLYFHHFPGR